MYILKYYITVIIISVVVLVIAEALDTFVEIQQFTLPARFIVQIPVLVAMIDMIRRVFKSVTGFSQFDLDGIFFFAAPIAAAGSHKLMTAIVNR